MPLGKIKYNPYTIFKESRTPPGLYARQRWLGQSETDSYKADFNTTVAGLKSSGLHLNDRSEGIIEALHRLFGLHLTVREVDPYIESTLRRVIEACEDQSQPFENALAPNRLQGLPFAATRWEFLTLPATLFLSSIFGRADDPPVERLYSKLASDVLKFKAFQNDTAGMHNALRALIVHPGNKFRPAIDSLVSWMASRQTAEGDWGSAVPFFQAVNALAHLNTQEANEQFDKAFLQIIESQNKDGTWGSTDKEWQTFLVVHALRNKGVL
jgi:hypothetical protein